MTIRPLIAALLTTTLLAACASEPPPERHQSFGPPNLMPGMTPANGMGTFRGASGWHATTDSFQPAQPLPGGFKGY